MIRILSVGNSFSRGAHYHLEGVCASCGVEVLPYNLYIGGCSLERHWNNFCSDEPVYSFYCGRERTETPVSFSEALKMEKWDVITFQQCSPLSGRPQSYYPFLPNLYREVKNVCPDARYYIHQTWALEHGHWALGEYAESQDVMYRALFDAYETASLITDLPLIPAGDFVQKVRREVPYFNYWKKHNSLCSDGRHLSAGYGRYVAALAWAWKLFGIAPTSVTYLPDVPETDPQVLEDIKNVFVGL